MLGKIRVMNRALAQGGVNVKGRLNAYPEKLDNLFAVLAEFVN
jgi:hypothetical protein